MKKSLLAAVMVAVVGLGTVALAAGETFGGLPVVRVVVNGVELSTPGVTVEGRSMAPVRALAESLGGTVAWDQATFTATVTALDAAALKAENEKLKAEVAELKAKLQPAATPHGAVGTSRANPAAVGHTMTIYYLSAFDRYTAKVTLLEVIRGDDAWQKIKAANMFNQAPKDDTEYIAARIRFELVSIPDGKALEVSPADFKAVSAAGKEYDWTTAVPPEPSLRTKLYEGASHEGWAVFAVDRSDSAPILAYGRKADDGTGGIWFSLKPAR